MDVFNCLWKGVDRFDCLCRGRGYIAWHIERVWIYCIANGEDWIYFLAYGDARISLTDYGDGVGHCDCLWRGNGCI